VCLRVERPETREDGGCVREDGKSGGVGVGEGGGGGGEGLVGRWMVGGCGRGSDDECCWRREKVGGVVLER
jgi:hypothetical protein